LISKCFFLSLSMSHAPVVANNQALLRPCEK
jgi:hypothetical protein